MVDDVVRWLLAPSDPDGLAFDERHGTETRWFDLGNYEPIRTSVFDDAVGALDVGPEGWTFVDFGSGKGRAVLLAAKRPFASVIGVEHGRALHRRAERNVEAARERGLLVAPVTLHHGDATDWPLPDGPIVAYLYNPFGDEGVCAVVDRLAGREARLVYVNPWEAAYVEAAGWVRIAGGGRFPFAWSIYRPPAAPFSSP